MKLFEDRRHYLGCEVTLKVLSNDTPSAVFKCAFAECERIEKTYSRFLPDSLLSELNRHLNEWQEIPAELFDLLALGQKIQAQSTGAFDLSVKSILDGWGYDAGYSLQERSAGKTGPYELEAGRVRLSAELDLGGLGKGYAIDRMFEILAPLENVCVEAGGDLRVSGVGPTEGKWRIAFEHPISTEHAIGQVDMNTGALGCSSPSRRRWRDRHHLVDPRNAEPAKDMWAVYTQAETALLADIFSTSLFVLGFEKAKRMVGDFPVEAMLVGAQGQLWKSEGFKGELFKTT